MIHIIFGIACGLTIIGNVVAIGTMIFIAHQSKKDRKRNDDWIWRLP